MEKAELGKIIEKIKSENSKENAFFGIYYLNNEEDYVIKANKSGLELFAIELLEASNKFDEIIEDKEKTIIPFNPNEKWIIGDVLISYIEPYFENRIDVKEKVYIQSWKETLIKYCFCGILILLILFFVVGLKTVFNWFF